MLRTQLHTARNGNGMLQPDTFRPIVNGQLSNKPLGGLWTSTYIDQEYGSAWVQAMYDMDFIEPGEEVNCYLIEPAPSARIYTIDGLQDMYYLWDHYSYIMAEELGRHFIDFEALAHDYDALHLTEQGQWRTRYIGLPIFEDPEYDPNRKSVWETMNGWDCESTVWSRWAFQTVAYIGKRGFENSRQT